MGQHTLGQDILVGQILGHYRLIERVDEGGEGIVYRAHDLHLDNRVVAIKILLQGSLADDTARQRFRKEAHALSKLNHPNVASVIDFDCCDGLDYIAEEFIEGVSLSEMLENGPLPQNEMVSFGCQLCEGLAAAHEHSIIHRDVKPGNIRIRSDGRLKVCDFGLAKTLRKTQQPVVETLTASETQTVVGTLPYISPEQLRNEKLDGRTDIWAIGCVLYEMAVGRRPFLGDGVALIDEILHQPAPILTKFNPKLSTELNAVVQKCLDKDPERRYSTAREIAVDLQKVGSRSVFERVVLWTKRAAVLMALSGTIATIGWAGIRFGPTVWRGIWQWVYGEVSPAYESYQEGTKLLERWDKGGNLDAALALFKKSVQTDREFALGYSGLGEAYWAKYRLSRDPLWLNEAERSCRRAAELNNKLPAVFITLAQVHNGKGQYDLALEEIQRALQMSPHDPDAILGEAAVYANMGQAQPAEALYKKAIALRPQYWGGYYEIGVFYYRQHRNTDGAAAFQRALELTPDNALVCATLGGLLQLLHRDAESEVLLKRSIDLQPTYTAYNNLGVLYFRQRRWEQSAKATKAALELNSKDWRTWANLGMAYEWLNHREEAAAAFREELMRVEDAAKLSADDAEVQVELALLYSKKQQRQKAVEQVGVALALAPEDPVVLASSGEVYENLGDRSRALDLVQKALARGWTLAQMENDFGLRHLYNDPNFRALARKAQPPSPAQPQR